MLAKKTFKNQITIPKAVADQFAGIEYFEVLQHGRDIILRPAELRHRGEYLTSIRKKMKTLGVREQDIAAAVTWSRKGR